jgi:putative membrane protein
VGLIIRWLSVTAAIILASYVLDGIKIHNLFSAFFAAVALGILNALFRPILILLTLPINILTLGLFTFLINALMLKMASGIIPGFEVHGFWTAILGSLIISVISWILNAFVKDRGRAEVARREEKKSRGDDVIDMEKKGDRWEP